MADIPSPENNNTTLLSNILILSETMLQHARNAEWESLVERENDRKALMQQLASSSMDNDQKRKSVALLTSINAINRQLLALASIARSDQQDAALVATRNLKANKLYQQT